MKELLLKLLQEYIDLNKRKPEFLFINDSDFAKLAADLRSPIDFIVFNYMHAPVENIGRRLPFFCNRIELIEAISLNKISAEAVSWFNECYEMNYPLPNK